MSLHMDPPDVKLAYSLPFQKHGNVDIGDIADSWTSSRGLPPSDIRGLTYAVRTVADFISRHDQGELSRSEYRPDYLGLFLDCTVQSEYARLKELAQTVKLHGYQVPEELKPYAEKVINAHLEASKNPFSNKDERKRGFMRSRKFIERLAVAALLDRIPVRRANAGYSEIK